MDTNVLVSALLLTGVSSELVLLWQRSAITLLLSRDILEEYLRVLSYPKFQLSEAEIKSLTEEELLPYVEVVNPRRPLRVVERDPSDNKFLECAITGKARVIISGDKDCCPSAVTGPSTSNRQPSFSPRIRIFGNRSCQPTGLRRHFNSVPEAVLESRKPKQANFTGCCASAEKQAQGAWHKG